MTWQLISDDESLSNLHRKTTSLSTVELPMFGSRGSVAYAFESCVFGPSDSDVLERYQSREDAISGHERLEKELGLTRTR